MSIKSCLLLMLFLSEVCEAQTCIVAKIQGNGEMFLGSDTRVTELKFNYQTQQFDSVYGIGRKIFHVGHYCFGTYGFMIDVQKKIADSVCLLNYSPSQTVETYNQVFFQKQLAVLADYGGKQPATLNEIIKGSSLLSSTVFCCFENDTPIIRFAQYTFVTSASGETQLKFETGFTRSDSAIVFGINDHANILKRNKQTWVDGPVNGIRKLISVEADRHPKHVSKPIDIFVIRKEQVKLTRYRN
jgi:hypothetical protein